MSAVTTRAPAPRAVRPARASVADQLSASVTSSPAASARAASAAPRYPAPRISRLGRIGQGSLRACRRAVSRRRIDPGMSFADTLDALADEGGRRVGPARARRCSSLAPHAARAPPRDPLRRVRLPAATARACTRGRSRGSAASRSRVGILVPALLFVDLERRAARGIVIGIPLVAAIGLVDDLRGLTASTKLLLVMAAALHPGHRLRHDVRAHRPAVREFDFGPSARRSRSRCCGSRSSRTS